MPQILQADSYFLAESSARQDGGSTIYAHKSIRTWGAGEDCRWVAVERIRLGASASRDQGVDELATQLLACLGRVSASDSQAASDQGYQLLEPVASVVLERFADFVGLDLAGEMSHGSRVVRSAEWVAPSLRQSLDAQRFTQPSWRGHPLTTTLLTSDALNVETIRPDGIALMHPEATAGQPAFELGLRSIIVVPLRSSGRALGTLVLAALNTSKPFDVADLEVAALIGVSFVSLLGQIQPGAHAGNEVELSVLWHSSPTPLVRADADGRVVGVNPAFLQLLQLGDDDVVGSRLRERINLFDVETFDQLWRDARAEDRDVVSIPDSLDGWLAGDVATHPTDVRLVDSDGEDHWVSLGIECVRDHDDELAFVCFFQDISSSKALEQQVAHTVFHDPLTGLANSLAFSDRILAALQAPDRAAGSVAVLVVDVERFRSFNERLGHQRGDELLIAVARRLQMSIGAADVLSRLSNDEFGILCEQLDGPSAAHAVAEQIIDLFNAPIPISGMQVMVHVSIGVASAGQPIDDSESEAEQLLANARKSMRTAKAQIKSRFVVHDPSAGERSALRIALEMELASLDARQLGVAYQPVFATTANLVVSALPVAGVEVLSRWIHPERGILDADVFVDIAERSGLIIPINAHSAEVGLATFALWVEQGLVDSSTQIYLIVSSREVLRGGIAGSMAALSREHNVSPAQIVVEIDSRAFDVAPASAMRLVAELRAQHFSVGIDNAVSAGAWHQYLGMGLFSVVKLSPRVVTEDFESSNTEWLRHSVLAARTTGALVVAKGVETADQLDRAASLGVGAFQGRALASPLDADSATAFLLARG